MTWHPVWYNPGPYAGTTLNAHSLPDPFVIALLVAIGFVLGLALVAATIGITTWIDELQAQRTTAVVGTSES